MRSFQETRKFAEKFEELRMVHNFSKSWDVTEYKSCERDMGQFRRDMVLLKYGLKSTFSGIPHLQCMVDMNVHNLL